MCQQLGVVRRVTSPYNPRCDGQTERTNQTIFKAIELLAANHPQDWDLFLDYTALAIRTSVSTVTGFSPFELMFGRLANVFKNYSDVAPASSSTPESIIRRVQELRQLVESTHPTVVDRIKQVQEKRQTRIQDQRVADRNFLASPLQPGTVVFTRLLRKTRKLNQPKFAGPYRVTSVTPTGNYQLVNTHGNHLKRSYPITQLKVIFDPAVANEIWRLATDPAGKTFPVDRILDHRHVKGKTEYLVRWKGFDGEDNDDLWLPASSITDPDLFNTYWQQHPDASKGSSPSA
jgi:hypothetical protein